MYTHTIGSLTMFTHTLNFWRLQKGACSLSYRFKHKLTLPPSPHKVPPFSIPIALTFASEPHWSLAGSNEIPLSPSSFLLSKSWTSNFP